MVVFHRTSAFTLALLLSACVTINVYFPAAAAERAADQIIEGVLGEPATNDAAPNTVPGTEPTTSPQSHAPTATPALVTVLHWLIPAAHASEADLNVSSPDTRRLQAQMAKRHNQYLKAWLDQGVIGYNANGDVAIRNAKGLPLPKRGKLRAQVNAENADRNALYQAIANANGHPEWLADIRATFAARWVAKARPGWYVDNGGGWQQK